MLQFAPSGTKIRFIIYWRATGSQQNDNYCVPTAR